jgi:hypothetical protein
MPLDEAAMLSLGRFTDEWILKKSFKLAQTNG